MLKGTITFYSDVQKYIRSQVMAFKKIFHRQKINSAFNVQYAHLQ